VRTCYLVLVGTDGERLEGRWDGSPGIVLHTGVRGRPDARVVAHHHAYNANLMAAMGRLPEITHQAACMFDGSLALVDEYEGQVLDDTTGEWLTDYGCDADGIFCVWFTSRR
jgi:ribulose-5-phosphate 4-epimerase/fuculose-1-phosphate aldolase